MKGTLAPKLANNDSALTRCLVEGDSAAAASRRRSRRNALVLSLTIEAALLGSLIVSPLLTGAQEQLRRVSAPMTVVLGTWHSHDLTRRPADPGRMPSVPTMPMPSLVMRPAASVPIRSEAAQTGGYSDDAPAGFLLDAQDVQVASFPLPKLELPKVSRPSMDEAKPLKVSEGVVEAQLISRVEPRYPPLGVQTRTEGAVRLHAIISRDGRIEALDVLSGPPLLVQAAVAAVKQWRYRPKYLNGETVEVETSITVIFRLQS